MFGFYLPLELKLRPLDGFKARWDAKVFALSLALLVLGVGANYHDSAATTDDAALFANFFD